MTGKWHLGHGEGAHPAARGFDRSFALEASGADNWERKSYLPIYDDAPWYEDGKPADLPEDFYSSEFIVDKTIEYLEESRDEGRPFFSYVAFMAIHIPVQAPREFIEKYEGVYDEGWEALRAARFRAVVERVESCCLAEMELGPMPEGLRDWAARSEDEKRMLAKSMAVNAAMLEAMDFHVGRLIDYLKETGQYDNTIFIVLSDNGPGTRRSAGDAGFPAMAVVEQLSPRPRDAGREGLLCLYRTGILLPGVARRLLQDAGGRGRLARAADSCRARRRARADDGCLQLHHRHCADHSRHGGRRGDGGVCGRNRAADDRALADAAAQRCGGAGARRDGCGRHRGGGKCGALPRRLQAGAQRAALWRHALVSLRSGARSRRDADLSEERPEPLPR